MTGTRQCAEGEARKQFVAVEIRNADDLPAHKRLSPEASRCGDCREESLVATGETDCLHGQVGARRGSQRGFSVRFKISRRSARIAF